MVDADSEAASATPTRHPRHGDHWAQLAAVALTSPRTETELVDAVHALRELERAVAAARGRLAVRAVLHHGWSYARLGRELGTTRQAAAKSYGPVVDAELRRRVRQSTAAAVAAGEITVTEITDRDLHDQP